MEAKFNKFVNKHGRKIKDKDDYERRFHNFEKNKKIIDEENAKEGQTYKLALNEFADEDEEEYK